MSGLVSSIPDHQHAFRWSDAGMVDLTPIPRLKSDAEGISSDGRVIVGSEIFVTGMSATRWTGSSVSKIGKSNNSYASGANSDGSVVVGGAKIGDFWSHVWHPFRWSAAGEQDLGTFGGTWGTAAATSSDGRVVVGSAMEAKGTYRAFRWTNAGMANLGTLGGDMSGATGVSADGAVVVGGSNKTNNGDSHVFLWTSAGMIDLGTLGGRIANANGVSADGSVVVGLSQIPGSSDYHAFRWTKASGMQDLNTLLSNAGVNMTGITLLEAVAISGNGEYIVGSANFPGKQSRSFIVRFAN
jgi:probable HAF family extracellular repeat protein